MMRDDCDITETSILNNHHHHGNHSMDQTVAMVTVTNVNVPCFSNSHTPDNDNDEDEPHFQNNDNKDNVRYVVIVKCDDSYLKTFPGIIRFLQLVCSVVAVICLTSAGVDDYLLLPLAWHLRAFIFVSVSALLISFLLIILHITDLLTMLPINWPLFDFVVYSSLSLMYLLGTSLVATAVIYYKTTDSRVPQWTDEQLIVSVVLGFMCLMLYGATAIQGYRQWKGSGQFRRYRLSNQTPQRNSHRPSIVV